MRSKGCWPVIGLALSRSCEDPWHLNSRSLAARAPHPEGVQRPRDQPRMPRDTLRRCLAAGAPHPEGVQRPRDQPRVPRDVHRRSLAAGAPHPEGVRSTEGTSLRASGRPQAIPRCWGHLIPRECNEPRTASRASGRPQAIPRCWGTSSRGSATTEGPASHASGRPQEIPRCSGPHPEGVQRPRDLPGVPRNVLRRSLAALGDP